MVKQHLYLFLLGALLSSSLCASEIHIDEELLDFTKSLKKTPNLGLLVVPDNSDSDFKLKSPDFYDFSIEEVGKLDKFFYYSHGLNPKKFITLQHAILFLIQKGEKNIDIKLYDTFFRIIKAYLDDYRLYHALPRTYLWAFFNLHEVLLKDYRIQYQKYLLYENIANGKINELLIPTILTQGKMNHLLFPPSWNDLFFPTHLQQLIRSYITLDLYTDTIPLSQLNIYISFLEKNIPPTPKNLYTIIELDIQKRNIQKPLFSIAFKHIHNKTYIPKKPLSSSLFMDLYFHHSLEKLQQILAPTIHEQLLFKLLQSENLKVLLPKSWGALSEEIDNKITGWIHCYVPMPHYKNESAEDWISETYINTYISLLEKDPHKNIKSVHQILEALEPHLLKQQSRLQIALKKFKKKVGSLLNLLIETNVVKGPHDHCFPLNIDEKPQITNPKEFTTSLHENQSSLPPQNTSVNPAATLKD